MRITFFLNQFPEPSETFVINQIIGLIKLGYEVNIIATRKGDLSHNHQAVIDYSLVEKTTYLTNESAKDSTLTIRLKRVLNVLKPKNIIKKIKALNIKHFGIHSKSLLLPSIVSCSTHIHEADVFIAHFGTAGVVANKMKELNLLKGKLVTVFHGSDISVKSILNVFQKDYKRLFETSDLMLPISELWKNRLIELGCHKNKIRVNRMGINSQQFECRAFDTPLSKPLKIITVARFIEKKGLFDALSAIKILKDQGLDFEYSIVGGGKLQDAIEDKIKVLNLQNCTSLLGFQPQEKISKLLQSADVFLLPSITAPSGDMEGIPVALMEAMAMGLITVSTYHSGIPELITNHKSGLLAPEHSPETLAQAITSLVTGELNIAKMREMAKLTIQEKYEQSMLYEQLASLLVEVYEQ